MICTKISNKGRGLNIKKTRKHQLDNWAR